MSLQDSARIKLILDGSIPSMLFKLATPNMISVLFMLIITFSEIFFAGQLGIISLAAVSVVFPLVSLAGMSKATVADTIADQSLQDPIPAQPIDPPTITVTFGINDSPLAGRDGKKVQSRVIRDRLLKECESNVAIKMVDTPSGEAFDVSGRGELQMGVLIENMRREGFELSISRPRVIYKDVDGVKNEPVEEVTIDVDEEFSGVVIEKLSARKGEMVLSLIHISEPTRPY